ncbi:MAG: ABC transporter ATP-binding protein [Bacteroidota bacterium]
MLEITDLAVGYGEITALHGISLKVAEGQIASIIGANGAGKTTLLRAISALIRQRQGSIRFMGAELSRRPHEVVRSGIVQVPEGRRIFAGLTVRENLIAGAYLRSRREAEADMEMVFGFFPILAQRAGQHAGTLSGGEQQMLAVARGLMSRPRLMLLDEPSLGLAPLVVASIMETIARIRNEGVTVLMVEQNARKALALSDQAYVLENGRITMAGTGRELLEDPGVRRAYLGERR